MKWNNFDKVSYLLDKKGWIIPTGHLAAVNIQSGVSLNEDGSLDNVKNEKEPFYLVACSYRTDSGADFLLFVTDLKRWQVVKIKDPTKEREITNFVIDEDHKYNHMSELDLHMIVHAVKAAYAIRSKNQ